MERCVPHGSALLVAPRKASSSSNMLMELRIAEAPSKYTWTVLSGTVVLVALFVKNGLQWCEIVWCSLLGDPRKCCDVFSRDPDLHFWSLLSVWPSWEKIFWRDTDGTPGMRGLGTRCYHYRGICFDVRCLALLWDRGSALVRNRLLPWRATKWCVRQWSWQSKMLIMRRMRLERHVCNFPSYIFGMANSRATMSQDVDVDQRGLMWMICVIRAANWDHRRLDHVDLAGHLLSRSKRKHDWGAKHMFGSGHHETSTHKTYRNTHTHAYPHANIGCPDYAQPNTKGHALFFSSCTSSLVVGCFSK